MNEQLSRCGYVAIIGKPNVGKSTLLNQIIGQKLSIISHKKQTTRHVIRGVKTIHNTQIIYVDTPGIHQDTENRALNRYMNRVARTTLHDVDLVLFLVSAVHQSEEDALVLEQVKKAECPVILVVNKVDELGSDGVLLETLEKLSHWMSFAAVVPISAKTGKNIDQLESVILTYIPEGPHWFDDNQLTDRDENFFVAEVIREKLFHETHQEVPYSSTVVIEKQEIKNNIKHIYATIYLEKQSQKAIVIGKQGSKLKKIGQQARIELEAYFGLKVFLQLWVKVKEDWPDSDRSMHELGFD